MTVDCVMQWRVAHLELGAGPTERGAELDWTPLGHQRRS